MYSIQVDVLCYIPPLVTHSHCLWYSVCYVYTREKAIVSCMSLNHLEISSKVLSESLSTCKKKCATQRGLEGEYVRRRLICLVSNAAQLSPSPTHSNQQLYRAADTTTVTSRLEMTVCVHVCKSEQSDSISMHMLVWHKVLYSVSTPFVSGQTF